MVGAFVLTLLMGCDLALDRGPATARVFLGAQEHILTGEASYTALPGTARLMFLSTDGQSIGVVAGRRQGGVVMVGGDECVVSPTLPMYPSDRTIAGFCRREHRLAPFTVKLEFGEG